MLLTISLIGIIIISLKIRDKIMGRSTKNKIAEREIKESQMHNAINFYTKKIKEQNLNSEKPLIETIPNELRGLAIKPYSSFYIKTKSSNRSKQSLELAKYMFCKYSVPKILDQAWDSDNRSIVYKAWFVCIATGGSLHKTHLKEHLTKKEAHLFINCNRLELNIQQAIFYAIAKAAGAEDGMAFRIAKSKLSEKNYSSEFWRNCVRFFATNHADSINQLNDLTDFLSDKIREDNTFSIFGHGHTVKTLLEKMKDWHYALRRAKDMGTFQWAGIDVPDEIFEKKNERGESVLWKFKQILTSKELVAEGTAMHHCVYSYKTSCMKGTCTIWSLSIGDMFESYKRKVTLEVRGRNIVQARGFANRSIKNDERHIILQWANKNDLNFSAH